MSKLGLLQLFAESLKDAVATLNRTSKEMYFQKYAIKEVYLVFSLWIDKCWVEFWIYEYHSWDTGLCNSDAPLMIWSDAPLLSLWLASIAACACPLLLSRSWRQEFDFNAVWEQVPLNIVQLPLRTTARLRSVSDTAQFDAVIYN